MNVYDSRLIAKILCENGYTEVDNEEKADVIIVNTCSVRKHAEDRAIGKIKSLRQYKNKNIGVVGCMAESLKLKVKSEKLKENTMNFVDFMVGPADYRRLPAILSKETLNSPTPRLLNSPELYSDIYPDPDNEISAFVPVMRGCDNYCSYCVVPYLRGKKQSRPYKDILEEVHNLLTKGIKEIMLLGQSIDEYEYNGINFAKLLALVADTGVPRLNFTTSHPKDMSQEIIEVMGQKENIYKWLHLPLQSGSDKILKTMNRGYTKERYLELIRQARAIISDISLSTDIIVGFPGENESDYRDTIELIKEVRFDSAYMFKYSNRPGTSAEQFDSKITEEVKAERLAELIDIQNKITYEKNKLLVGTTQRLLIEKRSKQDNAWYGKSDRNKAILVDGEVKPGDFVEVEVTCLRGWTPFGKIKNT